MAGSIQVIISSSPDRGYLSVHLGAFILSCLMAGSIQVISYLSSTLTFSSSLLTFFLPLEGGVYELIQKGIPKWLGGSFSNLVGDFTNPSSYIPSSLSFPFLPFTSILSIPVPFLLSSILPFFFFFLPSYHSSSSSSSRIHSILPSFPPPLRGGGYYSSSSIIA
ncbi:hypothetical protein G7K_6879-t1 [Saitoella complicata NRRL Y-17804]|uniref:Uncharacterized protein n=1 Tax=Saitoella complicata (strain BCRC 22490 / CBS 7301 / JCM 7358 / NBRC 10748 / NRRL Y-17804) TaxID=698492 RepID=A0A0E9NSE0_SAICN|nr:hypothetical protein G7K_6879-t1 [Saitoella complicata NRRL Y-17804]